ncbi:DUF5667 domain-containing protein [Chloroflexota bacterium]
MKKLFMVPLIAILALTLCFSGAAYAQEAEATLPDPGTTPDSPFYFMDKWGKQISLAFTFNAEEKAQKSLRYADERMAEIDAMMVQNKVKEATQAANEYQNCLQTATRNMERAKLKGADVSGKMVLMAERHLAVANRISANASEEAKAVLTQTRERARVSQETALKNMAQGDPEKAAHLNLQLIERQLNRILVQSEDPEAEGIQQRMEEYNRLGNLGEEISQIAKGLGKETTIDQLVGQATAHHLEVLAQVQERVQGEAQEAIENAIQNRIQTHEQVMNRLQAQNQLGPVPQEAPVPNAFQNRTGQSTQSTTAPTVTEPQASQGTQNTGAPSVTPAQTGQASQSAPTSSTTTTPTGQGGLSGGSQQGH